MIETEHEKGGEREREMKELVRSIEGHTESAYTRTEADGREEVGNGWERGDVAGTRGAKLGNAKPHTVGKFPRGTTGPSAMQHGPAVHISEAKLTSGLLQLRRAALWRT